MAGGGDSIGVDKSAEGGIIVAGLEVVELSFGVVDIATVAQGVILANGIGVCAGDRQDIVPGIVGAFNVR